MIERLLELIRLKMLSPSHLADAIGVQRSGISHLVSGRNKPSLDFIIRILNYFPDISPDWLLFGKLPVYREGYEGISPASATPSIALDEEKRDKDLPGPSQASLLNELFVKTESTVGRKPFSEDQGVKYQSAETKQKSYIETESPKKEKVKVSGGQDKIEREKLPERIMIFYNDHTFREYLPE